jgi:hypothetical protein
LLGVSLAIALLAVLVAVEIQDRASRPRYDYRPLSGSSALDAWTAPWQSAEASDGTGAVAAACEPPQRWLVVGWDAADWRLLLPLVEAGQMPNLERLMRGGSYGTLATFLPSISPALWTSVATGVTPADHGILGFYDRQTRLRRWWGRVVGLGRLDRELFSNADRRVKAAWNLLSEAERRVLVVGYHNTFPVEPVEGAMVSNYLVQDAVADMMAMRTSDSGASGLVFPAPLLEELLSVQQDVQSAAPTELWRFADVPVDERPAFLERARKLDMDADRRPYLLLRSYLFDTINARIAERLYPRVQPDVAFVHFQSADWATHQFLYFHEPERFDEMPWSSSTRAALEAQLPRYRGTVTAFYRYLDEELGRLVALLPAGTAVMLLSDHGVGPGADPDVPGYHDDGPPGILVLEGPGIRAGARLSGATLYDVMPTLVASLGLPVADDLAGRVIEDAFCSGALPPIRHVPSYEDGERYTPAQPEATRLQRDVLEQLESLGYVD